MKPKSRRNLPKLLEVYHIIVEYIGDNKEPPTMMVLVEKGCAKSTNTIRYYYDEMVELGMGERTPTRRLNPLPLGKAAPQIRMLLEKELSHD
jgi:hypothetical protein